MFKAAFVLISLWMLASCANAPQISPAVRADLAPTGTLRVGIKLGNEMSITPAPAGSEPRGIAVDLGADHTIREHD